MQYLLRIVEKSQEIHIGEEKLRFVATKLNIWDHFGITRSQYVSLNSDEKSRMLQGYYKNLMPVYFGYGKKSTFCCSNCVWFDGGKKQDCLRCGVNFVTCSCFEFSSDVKHTSNKLSIQNVESIFKKQEENLFERENGDKSGFYSSDLRCLSNKNLLLKNI